MARSTVSVARGEEAISVVVSLACERTPDRIVLAIDEEGDRVRLSPREREEALALARAGVDETGR